MLNICLLHNLIHFKRKMKKKEFVNIYFLVTITSLQRLFMRFQWLTFQIYANSMKSWIHIQSSYETVIELYVIGLINENRFWKQRGYFWTPAAGY